MPDAVRIVTAGAQHLDALTPLFDGYRQFYGQPGDEPASRAFLTARIEAGDSVIFFAEATVGGGGAWKAAGMAQLYPTFSSVSLGARWILNDLFVAPEARRLGVGRALTERCMAHCRETGAIGMMLLTEVTNTSAQRLYESLNWARDETYWRYTWKS